MGLRIIAYPAFRDAARGDGFAADCLVSRGVGLKSLRICSFLARRNSLRNFRALATRRTHRRQPETPNVWVRGANGRRVSRGRFRVVGCGAFRLDFDGGLGGESEETALFLPIMTPRHSRTSRVPGLKEIGCTGLAAPRLCGSALACSSFRAVARERPPPARS